MKLNIEIKNDEIVKSIKRLSKEMTSPRGAFFLSLRRATKLVVKNAARRYKRNFPTSARKPGPDVKKAILEAGGEVVQDSTGDVSIFMFDVNVLDELTKLPRTKATQRIYHLWRILHAGSGPKASKPSFANPRGRVKNRPYPLFVLVQTSSLEGVISADITGKFPPFPELLELEGRPGVKVVRHPGIKGKEWFLQNAKMFTEDVKIIQDTVNEGINDALRKAGFVV